jgi:hypothetical protein
LWDKTKRVFHLLATHKYMSKIVDNIGIFRFWWNSCWWWIIRRPVLPKLLVLSHMISLLHQARRATVQECRKHETLVDSCAEEKLIERERVN